MDTRISPTFPMNWHLQHQLILLNTNLFTFFSMQICSHNLHETIVMCWHGELCMNFNVRHEPCKFSMTKKTSKKFVIATWNIEHDDLYLNYIIILRVKQRVEKGWCSLLILIRFACAPLYHYLKPWYHFQSSVCGKWFENT